MAVPALGVDDTDSGKEQVDAAPSQLALGIVGGSVLSSIVIASRGIPKTSTTRADFPSKRYEAEMKILERIREKRTMPNESIGKDKWIHFRTNAGQRLMLECSDGTDWPLCFVSVSVSFLVRYRARN